MFLLKFYAFSNIFKPIQTSSKCLSPRIEPSTFHILHKWYTTTLTKRCLTLYLVELPYGNKLLSCSFCDISRNLLALNLKFSGKILQIELVILSYCYRGYHQIFLSYDEKYSKKEVRNFCVFEIYSKRASFWYIKYGVKMKNFKRSM